MNFTNDKINYTNDFYFDTSIWLDIYEKRGYNGICAKKLLRKVIINSQIVAYSDLNIKELKHLGYSKIEVNSIFGILKPLLTRRVHILNTHLNESRKISRKRVVPLKDVLHAVICRDYNLQLISRDNHFTKLKDISSAKLPEEFI